MAAFRLPRQVVEESKGGGREQPGLFDICFQAVLDVTGLTVETVPNYSVYTVVPSQETWDVGDRQGLCLAGLPAKDGTFIQVDKPLGGDRDAQDEGESGTGG